MRQLFKHILVGCFMTLAISIANAQNRELLNEYIEAYKSISSANQKAQVYALIDISWEYLYINTDTALNYAELAVEIAEKSNNKLALANALGMLGAVKDVKGNLQGSLQNYLKALEICSELPDSNCIGKMNNNIGTIFYAQEEYAKACPYFEKSLEIEISFKDTIGQIGSLVNLAIMKKNIGALDTSKATLLRALELSKTSGDPYYLGTIYANLGSHAIAVNKLDEALQYFKLSLPSLKSQNQLRNYAISKQNIASIHLKKGNIQLALSFAKEAKKVSEKGNFFLPKTETYETLYETFLALNQMDSAFHYKMLFQTYNDSIRLKENKEIVDELEAKYKTAEKETQLLTEKVKLEKEKKASEVFKYLIGFSLALLVISFAFYRQKSKSNHKLAHQNKVIESSLAEKEVLMREIHHRVKNNIQAVKSVINIQKRKTNSEEVKQSLNMTLNRVNAMSLIHIKLYQQTQISEIDSKHYLTELIEEVLSSFGLQNGQNLFLSLGLTSHVFETDKLLTLGLIVNELVTNACKYGTSSDQVLHLSVTSQKTENKYSLQISDKGKTTQASEEISFGKELIAALTFKLEGTLDIDTSDGYLSTIKIPIS